MHLARRKVGETGSAESRDSRRRHASRGPGEDLFPYIRWEHAVVGTHHDEAYDHGRGAGSRLRLPRPPPSTPYQPAP
jgi:hypothetical protein